MKCLKHKDVNYISRLFLLAQGKAESERSTIVKTTKGSSSHMAPIKMSPECMDPFLAVHPAPQTLPGMAIGHESVKSF